MYPRPTHLQTHLSCQQEELQYTHNRVREMENTSGYTTLEAKKQFHNKKTFSLFTEIKAQFPVGNMFSLQQNNFFAKHFGLSFSLHDLGPSTSETISETYLCKISNQLHNVLIVISCMMPIVRCLIRQMGFLFKEQCYETFRFRFFLSKITPRGTLINYLKILYFRILL